jgi:peptide deformylase
MIYYSMMKQPLKIVFDPHPILRKRALPVSVPLNQQDRDILESLLTYIELSQDKKFAEKYKIREGVGLAAPQIGISKRLLAVSYGDKPNRIRYALANPVVIKNSVKKIAIPTGEGCLSIKVPIDGYVYRSQKISVKAYDLLSDDEVIIDAVGFDAIVLQHEIDHLNGILYYDHINKTDPFFEIPHSELL